MIKLAEKNICSGCGACASACPVNCIIMKADKEGFLYPEISSDHCIECKKCQKACPVIERNTSVNKATAYALKNNNDNIRLQSSSGGFFSLLAEYVIDRKGVVFGAAFDEKLCVRHICIESKEDIQKLRGSKYVQSIIGNTYLQAKKHLDNGTLVLFTGTPCQIEGLLKYLGREYSNLITQDIICHGVPSPDVWRKYTEWHEEKEQATIINASFRSKNSGWKQFSMMLKFDNGKEKFMPINQDLFLRSFLSDLCLRPSCYNCSFKGILRPADFTLADFWGVHNILPSIDDDTGVSLVLVNSKKAAKIFEVLRPSVSAYEVDVDAAIKYNTAATQSVKEPSARKTFMEEITSSSFEATVNKYCPPKNKKTSLKSKIIRKIKKIIKG